MCTMFPILYLCPPLCVAFFGCNPRDITQSDRAWAQHTPPSRTATDSSSSRPKGNGSSAAAKRMLGPQESAPPAGWVKGSHWTQKAHPQPDRLPYEASRLPASSLCAPCLGMLLYRTYVSNFRFIM